MLRLSEYDYDYPDDLVAQVPAEPRDASRLLVVNRAEGTLTHRHFRDLPEYLAPGDLLVANDTRVFPARLIGEKEGTGARVEVFLLRELNPEQHLWEALVAPARKLRVGNRVRFDGGALACEVLDTTNARGRCVRFDFDGTSDEFQAVLERIGHTPLPPYIRRDDSEADRDRYQTVFARHRGAVAAPTAGLHFTPALTERIAAQGVRTATVTLHVGIGTFKSVEVEDASKHHMDAEAFTISADTARAVNETKAARAGRVVAIGTTSVRALESAVGPDGRLMEASGWTDKFIHPPYTFGAVDALVTNFHMPRSTLLLLVAALAGSDLMREAYRVAVAERYRLFSYGDAMLIV